MAKAETKSEAKPAKSSAKAKSPAAKPAAKSAAKPKPKAAATPKAKAPAKPKAAEKAPAKAAPAKAAAKTAPKAESTAGYAIFASGGKQYSVKMGDVIDVELVEGTKGAAIEFKDVLFTSDGKKAKVGTPTVAKTAVTAEVVDQVRGPKVISYKYKKRKNYRRKVGHRQNYTRVKITGVTHGA